MVNAAIFAVLVVVVVGGLAGSVVWAIQWARKLKNLGIFEKSDRRRTPYK